MRKPAGGPKPDIHSLNPVRVYRGQFDDKGKGGKVEDFLDE
jgi:hypothetical protein